MTPHLVEWNVRNAAHLSRALQRVRECLERHARRREQHDAPDIWVPPDVAAAAVSTGEPPPALETISSAFGLTSFERDILLLCAGVEVQPGWRALLARAAGDERAPAPTFALAVDVLPGAHWTAFTAAGPLRYWHLVDVDPSAGLMASSLRIDETILHFLVGVVAADARLLSYVQRVTPEALPSSQAAHAERAALMWRGRRAADVPVLELTGRSPAESRSFAAHACASLGLELYRVDARDLPRHAPEQDRLARTWERDACLRRAALLLETDHASAETASTLAARMRGHQLVIGPIGDIAGRTMVRISVQGPSAAERQGIWRTAVGEHAAALNGGLGRLASEFDLTPSEVADVARQALAEPSDEELEPRLWRAARTISRARLDTLAERIDPRAHWDDLVLPRAQLDALHVIAAHVRHRERAYAAWGFGQRCARGLGISSVFAGPSGTGKTMAAEVLAAALGLDLYRIDLSQVVSKYIGETEKNLKRIFDAAECGGLILLFDEADALFGRRSDVRDSHDRYANIEVSYLLQRVDAFRGLAVLTTNRRSMLDPAFLRRIRFVVEFPFPDAAQRSAIWRRTLPEIESAVHAPLDFDRLGRLSVAGGDIRNIAMTAAVISAERSEPLGMAHLLRAARIECAKLEKGLSEAEVAGWR